MPIAKSVAEALKKRTASLIRGAAGERDERQAADVAARKSDRKQILSPDDVLGKYNAKRLLYTTLGGTLRPITDQDLREFQRNAKAAGRRYRAGITAQTVIDHSRAEDRKRAQREIKFSVPLSHAAGMFQFATNASPQSNVRRHYVAIDFINYSAVLASPRAAAKMADYLVKSYLKFDCDCGRHRFWFRYISTIGRFNAGRDETGFPKIRNPGLTGVACKHVLRTMAVIQQPAFKAFLARAITKDRERVGRAKVTKLRGKDIEAIAQEQLRPAAIKARALPKPSPAAIRKAQASIQAVAAKVPRGSAKAKMHVDALLALKVISAKQHAAIVAQLKG
ncbi:hypothetical protein [Nevskia sp.]|uniref:hypothetical protein n=1 Tax=Nevskia sp. TaxID=1929292 RepID=UPI0025E870EE|nr:hypothetical protein [Nevskia sp.]